MAKSKNGGNGRVDRLEEAMSALALAQANLGQAQAALAQQQTAFLARIAEIDAHMAETNRRNAETFARMEERFARIETILLEHSRSLRALPDAIRDKIGFKTPRRKPRSDGRAVHFTAFSSKRCSFGRAAL